MRFEKKGKTPIQSHVRTPPPTNEGGTSDTAYVEEGGNKGREGEGRTRGTTAGRKGGRGSKRRERAGRLTGAKPQPRQPRTPATEAQESVNIQTSQQKHPINTNLGEAGDAVLT